MRAYVEQGGGLRLAFDTSWFVKSPFPEIAVHGIALDHDKTEVDQHAHVIGADFEAVKPHSALGDLQAGTRYRPIWREQMIFKTGPKATVLIRNEFGDPVCAVATLGKGRVAFAGSYDN